MLMELGSFILSIAIASISPLTDQQRTALDTAFDGRDHQEAAFTALVENVRSWTDGLGDAAIRLDPDYQAILENPDQYRGELCKVTGKLQQHNPLPGTAKLRTQKADSRRHGQEDRPVLDPANSNFKTTPSPPTRKQ